MELWCTEAALEFVEKADIYQVDDLGGTSGHQDFGVESDDAPLCPSVSPAPRRGANGVFNASVWIPKKRTSEQMQVDVEVAKRRRRELLQARSQVVCDAGDGFFAERRRELLQA